MADVTELALPNGTVLSELIFIYRYSFVIEEGMSIWNFCCGRFRTAFGTRAVNWNIQRDGSIIEIRSFDTLDKPPEGKYRLLMSATSSDGTQEAGCCIDFSGQSCDIAGTPFQETVTSLICNESNFLGGSANIRLELTFAAQEFTDPIPDYTLPEIPSHLAADDYRNVMVKKISEINDFTIETLSGIIRTVRILLILSTQYFRDFITRNPTADTATLPFNKQVVDEVLKYALTGSFDLEETDLDVLDEFLSCIGLILPINTHALTENIAVKLRTRVNKEWQAMALHEVLKLLVLSCKHGLWELSYTVTNLISNVHYKVFLRDYNSHSSGENLQLYRQLSEQTFRFIHPLDNIRRKYEQSVKMRPIMRFSSIDTIQQK